MNNGQAAVSEHISLERLWSKLNEVCQLFGVEVTENKSFIDLWTECVEYIDPEVLLGVKERIVGSDILSSQMAKTVEERLQQLNKC
ncbi:hypothetical protein [Cytobacillus horneckiae]|uniref:Uncharacterized protein n=1 Tax=Cytobacillus horneckiae TaxID=549687 RepID=A0A2N0ZB70_9BACI|nr:hypothetical protein [Cytobacillus horneckiae]MEC1155511.1 hypothetical protein [Cytobacillus horneckiae]MED2936830.1 hypothetical protein [Cytobacillus horneckiae]PKG26749.1 hypothetical protein CWS20_22480 [Cytobacillus horneckiae]